MDAVSASDLTGAGLPVGAPAPRFTLPDHEAREWSLDALLALEKPVVLIFSSPHCESCQALAPKLPGLAAQYQDAFRLVLVTRGSRQQNLEKLRNPGALLVLFQTDYEVSEAYNCTTTPAAVVVDTGGIVQSELALGALAIAQLLSTRSRPAGTDPA